MTRTFQSIDVTTNYAVGTLGSGIVECSGFAASRRHPGYLYTHNDSGNPNTILVMSAATGTVVATLTLDVSMIDWEDIAYYWDGSAHRIVVADIGNNAGTRTNQKLIAFEEPASLTSQSITTTSYPLTIDSPGTSLDCEAFMIRPSTGDTFIYMKANSGVTSSGLYQGPSWSSLQTGSTNHFSRIINHSLHQVTAGDWGDDDYYVLNTNGTDPTFDTYGGMYVFDNTHTLVDSFQGHKTVPISPSEAVGFSHDGNTMYRSFDGGGTAGKDFYAYPIAWESAPVSSANIDTYWKRATGQWKRFKTNALIGGGGGLPTIPVMSSDTFRSFWGTRVFPFYANVPYEELLTPAGAAWLTDYRPGFISSKMTPTIAAQTDTMQFFEDVADAGIGLVFTMGEPFTTYTSTEWDEMLAPLTGQLAGKVWMVTGQNEVNHIRGGATDPPGWETGAQAHQIELWNRMQVVNTTLSGLGHPVVKVGSPNLWSGNVSIHNADVAVLAPLVRDYCNQVVYHLYPRGNNPDWNVDAFKALYNTHYPGKPIWCTECGYFDAMNYVGGSQITTEWASDIYIRKMWLEYAWRGIPVSQFEFLDDVDASNSDREANLGLIETPAISEATWTPKDAYTNTSLMTALTGGVDGNIGCTVTTETSDVKYVAVNHSGGTRLFLWTSDNIENTDTHLPISVSTRVVTIVDAAGTHVVNVAEDVEQFDLTGTVT